ncbi:MAG: leucine-rich repeat protein, partial [Lachnospiraceae bacterium]|nr:leucine-rich repeat protein [Lachnospiraceae bacterium]
MKKPLLNLKFILSLILCVTCMVGLMMPAMASGEGEGTQLTGDAQTLDAAASSDTESSGSEADSQAFAMSDGSQGDAADAQTQGNEGDGAQQEQDRAAQTEDGTGEVQQAQNDAQNANDAAQSQENTQVKQQDNTQAQNQDHTQEQQDNIQEQQDSVSQNQDNTQTQDAQKTSEDTEINDAAQNTTDAQETKENEDAQTAEGSEEEKKEEQQETLEDPDSANIDGIYYHLDKENLTAAIFGGHAATIGETLVIPAKVTSPRSGNTYKVTAVEDNAFRGSAFAGIRHLTIEEGIERIGNVCFYGLQVEDTLVIPDSVTYIGDWSFGMGAFKKLVTGNGLVNMGSSVFAYGQFEEVTIAHDTKLLGYYAFNRNNTKINRITFEGVRDVNRHIGDDTVTELYPTSFLKVPVGDVYLPDAAGEDTVKHNVMAYLGRISTTADFFHWKGNTYHVEDGALYEVQGNTLKLIDTIMDYDDRDVSIPA